MSALGSESVRARAFAQQRMTSSSAPFAQGGFAWGCQARGVAHLGALGRRSRSGACITVAGERGPLRPEAPAALPSAPGRMLAHGDRRAWPPPPTPPPAPIFSSHRAAFEPRPRAPSME